MAGGARKEHAIQGAWTSKPWPVPLPVVLVVGCSKLRDQKAGVLKHASRQQAGIICACFGRRQRFERARVLECESKRER